MKKVIREKCPICGNYTFYEDEGFGIGDICPVCFCELGYDDTNESEDIEKEKENYKRVGACREDLVNYVRRPYGVELPGFNEPDNAEATSDPKYLEYKKYLENPKLNYEKAEERLSDYCGSTNHTPIFLDDEAFEIFNAFAFQEGLIGFKAAYSLAICYATGCGCKKNIDTAHYLLDDILKRYKIK